MIICSAYAEHMMKIHKAHFEFMLRKCNASVRAIEPIGVKGQREWKKHVASAAKNHIDEGSVKFRLF